MERLVRSLFSIIWFCLYIIATPLIVAYLPFYLLYMLVSALVDDVPLNIIIKRKR